MKNNHQRNTSNGTKKPLENKQQRKPILHPVEAFYDARSDLSCFKNHLRLQKEHKQKFNELWAKLCKTSDAMHEDFCNYAINLEQENKRLRESNANLYLQKAKNPNDFLRVAGITIAFLAGLLIGGAM